MGQSAAQLSLFSSPLHVPSPHEVVGGGGAAGSSHTQHTSGFMLPGAAQKPPDKPSIWQCASQDAAPFKQPEQSAAGGLPSGDVGFCGSVGAVRSSSQSTAHTL